MDSQDPNTFNIFIGKSHVEPKHLGRINGIAPQGYGLAIIGKDLSLRHWGYGGERNTEAMLAHGLLRGAHLIFIECEMPIIHVVTPKTGTRKYLTEFVPKWLHEGAKGKPEFTKDNLGTWRQLYDLNGLGKFIIRVPEGDDEGALSELTQSVAKIAAKEAFKEFANDRTRFAAAGVLATDEDAVVAKIDWD